MSYNVKVYRRLGGSELVVANGGKLVMQTGSQIVPNSETQAAAIADVNAATIAWTTGDKGKVNTLLAAVRAVGIIAAA